VTLSAKKKDINIDKLAINWENLAQVRFQFKFAFRIRPLVCFVHYLFLYM